VKTKQDFIREAKEAVIAGDIPKVDDLRHEALYSDLEEWEIEEVRDTLFDMMEGIEE